MPFFIWRVEDIRYSPAIDESIIGFVHVTLEIVCQQWFQLYLRQVEKYLDPWIFCRIDGPDRPGISQADAVGSDPDGGTVLEV